MSRFLVFTDILQYSTNSVEFMENIVLSTEPIELVQRSLGTRGGLLAPGNKGRRSGGAPGRCSKLLDRRRAAELRAAVGALPARAQSWRPPPRAPGDGPPAPDELLLIVLRSKRSPNTRRLYARELALFLGFCQRRGQPATRPEVTVVG